MRKNIMLLLFVFSLTTFIFATSLFSDVFPNCGKCGDTLDNCSEWAQLYCKVMDEYLKHNKIDYNNTFGSEYQGNTSYSWISTTFGSEGAIIDSKNSYLLRNINVWIMGAGCFGQNNENNEMVDVYYFIVTPKGRFISLNGKVYNSLSSMEPYIKNINLNKQPLCGEMNINMSKFYDDDGRYFFVAGIRPTGSKFDIDGWYSISILAYQVVSAFSDELNNLIKNIKSFDDIKKILNSIKATEKVYNAAVNNLEVYNGLGWRYYYIPKIVWKWKETACGGFAALGYELLKRGLNIDKVLIVFIDAYNTALNHVITLFEYKGLYGYISSEEFNYGFSSWFDAVKTAWDHASEGFSDKEKEIIFLKFNRFWETFLFTQRFIRDDSNTNTPKNFFKIKKCTSQAIKERAEYANFNVDDYTTLFYDTLILTPEQAKLLSFDDIISLIKSGTGCIDNISSKNILINNKIYKFNPQNKNFICKNNLERILTIVATFNTGQKQFLWPYFLIDSETFNPDNYSFYVKFKNKYTKLYNVKYIKGVPDRYYTVQIFGNIIDNIENFNKENYTGSYEFYILDEIKKEVVFYRNINISFDDLIILPVPQSVNVTNEDIPKITWNNVDGADSYLVKIYKYNPDTGNVVNNVVYYGSDYLFSNEFDLKRIKSINLPPGKYYIRIQPVAFSESFKKYGTKAETKAIGTSVYYKLIELKKPLLSNGWYLFGASANMNVSQLDKNYFNTDKTIWKWENQGWKVYSIDQSIKSILENYGIQTFNEIKKGEGYWVNIRN